MDLHNDRQVQRHTHLFVAINTLGRSTDKHRDLRLLAFFAHSSEETPVGPAVHVVCDNYSPHPPVPLGS
jgi:hypothetical protein